MREGRPVRFGIVVFPGSNCEYDAAHAIATFSEAEPFYLWHKHHDLGGADCVVLPGGFSYGDYLRPGAIACFSPIMREVAAFAREGGLVLGICNGFQILTEAHLLPGALLQNRGLKFICHPQHLRVERTDTPFSAGYEVGQVIEMPVNHNEGGWTPGPEAEADGRVVFRYCDAEGNVTDEANPNGSVGGVAGMVNERGNILGMMPHPERVSEAVLGGTDGREIFASVTTYIKEKG